MVNDFLHVDEILSDLRILFYGKKDEKNGTKKKMKKLMANCFFVHSLFYFAGSRLHGIRFEHNESRC